MFRSINPDGILGAPSFNIDLDRVDNDVLGPLSFDVIATYTHVRTHFDVKISAGGQIVTVSRKTHFYTTSPTDFSKLKVNDRSVLPGSVFNDLYGGSVQVFQQGLFVTVVINSKIIIRSGFERG